MRRASRRAGHAGPTIATVAVVGTGVIGRSWMMVFARAGCRAQVYDPDPVQAHRAYRWFQRELARAITERRLTRQQAARIRVRVTRHPTLKAAVAGVAYVQESGPERIEEKRAIFRELDGAAAGKAILASSTSALDMSEIAADLSGAGRCIVAHPVNPPHVIPAVEVLAGRETREEVVRRTCRFLASVGQSPVVLNKYAVGFALNRLQAALVREALLLVESGVADVQAVDTVVRDGLGLRWALMGPFGVGHTNADGGIREYYYKYGAAYLDLMKGLSAEIPSFDPAMVDRIARATEDMEGAPRHVHRTLAWRDRLIRSIRALKAKDPHP